MTEPSGSYVSVDPDAEFDDAADWLTTNPSVAGLPNSTKLEIYGLYKVATLGPEPDGPPPPFFSLPAPRAKYNAWLSAGKVHGLNAVGAKEQYIQLAHSIGWRPASERKNETPEGNHGGSGWVRVSTLAGNPEVDPEEPKVGRPDLLEASSAGEIGKVRSLLTDKSVDLNHQDEFGMSALHLAADRNRPEIVQLLLEAGADPSLKEQDGLTPYELAEISGRTEVMSIFGNAKSR